MLLGGFASQGYIRDAEATSKSSLHWAGLVQTASANQVLTIETAKRGAAGTVDIQTNEKGSVFHRKISGCKQSIFSHGYSINYWG